MKLLQKRLIIIMSLALFFGGPSLIDAHCGSSIHSAYDNTRSFMANDSSNESFRKSDKENINAKVHTFCSAGAYNEERCEKYCIELRDWLTSYSDSSWLYENTDEPWFNDGGSVSLCDAPNSSLNQGGAVAVKPVVPKIQKEIIKNDDGTTTEIVKKKINGQTVEVQTIFDAQKKKSYESVLTEVKDADGIVVKKNEKTILDDSQEFEKEVAEDVYDGEQLIKKTVTKQNEQRKLQNVTIYENGIVREKIIRDGLNNEKELLSTSHTIFNQGLQEYFVESKNVNIIFDKKDHDVQNIFYDVLESRLHFLKSDDALINDLYIVIDDGMPKVISTGNIDTALDVSVQINLEGGDIFVGNNENHTKLGVLPREMYDEILSKGDLNLIDNMRIVNDNEISYVVEGVKYKKLFGFYPMEFAQIRKYNVEDGFETDIVYRDRFGNILDKFSK